MLGKKTTKSIIFFFLFRVSRLIVMSESTHKIIFLAFCMGLMPLLVNAAAFHKTASLPQPIITNASLRIFVQQALESNPAIRAAEANVMAAQARQKAAAQPLYNPELTGEAQSSVEDTYSAGINQTVDWKNKRGAREKVGFADLQVAEAQLANLRQQFTAEILSALAAYQANQQVVSLAKERKYLLQQFVALTQKRHTNGDVPRVDVDLAQLALSEALAQQADAESSLNQALQTLRAITGFKQAHWPRFPTTLPKLQLTNDETEALLYQLPILQILNNQYLSAEARIRLAIKQRYPDPTIGVQGGYTKEGEEQRRLIGLTVSIPLFVRNPYRAEVDAANYDAIEADQKRLALVRQARAEIESSAERYQILYQATLRWQQVSGKPLSDGMTLIERLWQAGEINTTDYIVQLKQRVDSQIAGAELKGRAWQAWVDWLKASGQGERWLQHRSL